MFVLFVAFAVAVAVVVAFFPFEFMLHWFQRTSRAFNKTANDLIKLGIGRVQLNSEFQGKIANKNQQIKHNFLRETTSMPSELSD